MNRFPAGLVAVVLLLALGTGVGSAITPQGRSHTRNEAVEVIGATAVCPDLRQSADVLATRVSVGAGPLPAGRTSTGGTVAARRVSTPGATIPVPVTKSGEVAVNLGTTTKNDGLTVNATGDLAAALEVEQITRGETGFNRGLSDIRCEPPRPDLWFEGGSAGLGDDTTLILANVDDTVATVNITVFTSKGRVDAQRGQGLTVYKHSRTQVHLDDLVPGATLLALHVTANRGRVAGALRHGFKTVDGPEGVDWVPQTVPPATSVVVPGFPQGPGERLVYVTNPGTDDTNVSVRVTTRDAEYVPLGQDAVDVRAGRTVAIRLDSITKSSSLAATVTSDGGPIIAGGFVKDTQGTPVREFSYTAGALPLSGPALVTDVVINRPTESTLILSAPQGKASVLVTPLQVVKQAGKLPAPVTVSIGAGRTMTLKLSTFFPPGTNAQLAVEVRPTPGSGPVYAARYLRERGAHGPLTTLLVLEGPVQLVSRPAAVSDPQVGTP